jgi:hypothetical protein
MFINAVLFGVEENVRNTLHLGEQKTNYSINPTYKNFEYYKLYAISGAIAGFSQAILLSPVELVKIRMQIPSSTYSSSWSCAKDILSQTGFKGLMRGQNF